MAKNKDEIEDPIQKEMVQAFNKAFPEQPIQTLENSQLAEVPGWLDTGNYALNWISSRSIYNGFPLGRIVLLSGAAGAGKCAHLDTKVKIRNQDYNSARDYLDNYIPGDEGDSSKLVYDFISFEEDEKKYSIPAKSLVLTKNRGYVVADQLTEADSVFIVA